MTEKRKILFICHMSTFFTDLLGVMKLCLKHEIEPVIQFTCPLHTVIQNVQTCLDFGVEIYDTDGNSITDTNNIQIPAEKLPSAKNQVKNTKSLRKKFKNSPIVNWSNIKDRFEKRSRITREILHKLNPDLVILGSDITGHDTCICIREAHKFGIKITLVSMILADGDDPANFLANRPQNQMDNIFNKITGLIFPNWVYKYQGKKLLRLPASYVFYYKINNLAPKKPWVCNSGYSDSIILDGQKSFDFYLNAGLDKNKMYTLGSINNDILYSIQTRKEELKNSLYEKYNLDKNKKLIITALHPKYFMDGIKEFDNDYDKLSDYWIKTLKNTNYNIIGCPHPSLDISELKKYEDDNFKIYDGYTIDIIGLADIYVANISSTIKWAVMCGIPVINYDLANMDFKEYRNTPGIITVTNKELFEQELKFLTTDKTYYNKILAKQQEKSSYWGVLDGHAGTRIIEHLNYLMETK